MHAEVVHVGIGNRFWPLALLAGSIWLGSSLAQRCPAQDVRSPLDSLNRSHIKHLPIAEEIPELVALIGDDGGRHGGPAKCVAVSPDDTLVATGSRDETLQIRDAKTLKTVRTFQHSDDVDSVAFSADGTMVFSSCWDGKIRCWPIEGEPTDEPKWAERIGDDRCDTVFRDDGRQLVSFAKRRVQGNLKLRVLVMNLGDDGSVTSRVELDALDWFQSPSGSAISKDGKWLAASESASGDHVLLWDLASGDVKPKWVIEQEDDPRKRFEAVGFSLDEKSLVIGNNQGAIEHWQIDGAKPRLVKTVAVHTENVSSLAFDPTGSTLFSGSYDHQIAAHPWPLGSQQPAILQAHSNWLSQTAFDKAGQVMFSASWDHTIRRWTKEQAKWSVEPWVGHTDTIMAIGFSPDGRRMATASVCDIGNDVANRPLVWRVDGEVPELEPLDLPCTGWIHGVAFSHDGSRLAVCDDQGVRMFDANSGRSLETIRHTIDERGQSYDSPCESIVFRSDRLEIVSGWSQPFICTTSLEADTYKTLATATPPNHHIEALDLSADELLVASASTNLPWVWLLDSGTLELRSAIRIHAADRVDALDCSPVGKRLAVGTRNNLAVLIDDWENGEDQHSLKGHSSVVASVSFGHQGQVLASGDWDGNVILWNAEEKSEKTRWKFPGRIWKLAFAPDGRHLVVGDSTGKIYILRIAAANQ